MPLNIGQYVISGLIDNTRLNSVFGWLYFGDEVGMRVELTGNAAGPLAGKALQLGDPSDPKPASSELPDEIQQFSHRQIGVVAELQLLKDNVVRFRWFGQNGEVLAQLEPPFKILDAPPHVSSADDEEDDEESNDLLDEEGPDDPFGLFDEELEEKLSESLGSSDGLDSMFDSDPDIEVELTGGQSDSRWEGLDLDPETRQMYEQWDEIFDGDKDEPVAYLIDTVLRLPKPDAIKSNEEAQEYVVQILAQLAKLSVALDVCEHFEPIDTYRLLMDDILPNAKVHPNLKASDMVFHYSTSEYCSLCEAEYDKEFDRQYRTDPDTDEADGDSAESDAPPPGNNDERDEDSGGSSG